MEVKGSLDRGFEILAAAEKCFGGRQEIVQRAVRVCSADAKTLFLYGYGFISQIVWWLEEPDSATCDPPYNAANEGCHPCRGYRDNAWLTGISDRYDT